MHPNILKCILLDKHLEVIAAAAEHSETIHQALVPAVENLQEFYTTSN